MNILSVKTSSVSLSVIFLLFTVICGLWIEFSGNSIQKSDLTFHLILALTSIVSVIISFYLLHKN